MSELVLKLKTALKEDIRVFKGKFSNLTEAYNKLIQFINKSYDLNDNQYSMQYKDDENDLVTIATELDLEDALQQANDVKKLTKIFIKSNKVKNVERKEKDMNQNDYEMKGDNESKNDGNNEEKTEVSGLLCNDLCNNEAFRKEFVSFLSDIVLLYQKKDNKRDLITCVVTSLAKHSMISEHKQIKLVKPLLSNVVPQIESFISPILLDFDVKNIELMVNKFADSIKNGINSCNMGFGLPFLNIFDDILSNNNIKPNCPYKCGLIYFMTPKRGYECDGCELRMKRNSPMYGCRKCNYDLCLACYFNDNPFGNSMNPNCPGKCGLNYFRTSNYGYECDDCGLNMNKHSPMYGCRKCNFDLCLSCYKHPVRAFPVFPVFCKSPFSRRRHGGYHGFRHRRHGGRRCAGKPSRPCNCGRYNWRQHVNNNNSNNNKNNNDDVKDEDRLSAGIIDNPMPKVSGIVNVNEGIIKQWTLKNTGKKNLPKGLMVTYSGRANNPMVNVQQFNVGNKNEIKPGETFIVRICIKTPSDYGRYNSNWRLTTPDGKKFGQKLPFYLVLSPPNNDYNEVKSDDSLDTLSEKDETKKDDNDMDISFSDDDSIVIVKDKTQKKENEKAIPEEASENGNDNDNEKENEKISEYGYQKEFNILKAMGFNINDDYLKGLLNANEGNINKVTTLLLN